VEIVQMAEQIGKSFEISSEGRKQKIQAQDQDQSTEKVCKGIEI
jgi:hypothetical protein